jgi:hypothetical protein
VLSDDYIRRACIGLSTWFIGSQYRYSVLHFTTQYSSCNTSGIPCHHVLTLFNRTVALTLNYTRNSRNCTSLLSCQLTNSVKGQRHITTDDQSVTPKKTPPLLRGCVLLRVYMLYCLQHTCHTAPSLRLRVPSSPHQLSPFSSFSSVASPRLSLRTAAAFVVNRGRSPRLR